MKLVRMSVTGLGSRLARSPATINLAQVYRAVEADEGEDRDTDDRHRNRPACERALPARGEQGEWNQMQSLGLERFHTSRAIWCRDHPAT